MAINLNCMYMYLFNVKIKPEVEKQIRELKSIHNMINSSSGDYVNFPLLQKGHK